MEINRPAALLMTLIMVLGGCASAPPAPPAPPPAQSSKPGKELGKQFLLEARKQYRFVKDQEVLDAVNAMGTKIVLAAGQDPGDYHFFVVEEIQPNAFAIPGGYVFVFDGLLSRMESEDELAGVLSHEVAHVVHNHFFKDDPAISALGMATIAAILLSRGSGAAANIAIAANVAAQLKFSRAHEEEADRSAVKYLKASGYGTDGLFRFLKRLSDYEKIHGYDLPPYLSTHPILQERIQLAEIRAGRSGEGEEDSVDENWDRVRVRVRAKQQPESPVDWVVGPETLERGNAGQAHFLTGLAHLAAGRSAEAIEEYRQAVTASPKRNFYRAELALAYLKARQLKEAREAAETALAQAKGGREPESALLVLGMLEMQAGRAEAARVLFEKLVAQNPDHIIGNFQLGQACRETDRPLEGAYYSGRYLRLNLQPEAALREFRKAEKLAKDDPEAARRIKHEVEGIQKHGV